ncbi:MAG: DUF882 domain-containing protein [Deltaproteobacteria bacterium]|nr:DUF882 domain-containing protein [Deltaproteobacteria bacterium]
MNLSKILQKFCLLWCFFFFMFLPPALAQSKPGPFFLMGDGKLHIQNVKTQQEAEVGLLLPDGSFDESALGRIDAVFGFSGQGKGDHISPRLIFMLDYFTDLVAPGKVIFLTSGYRSPEYNDNLKKAGGIVAKTSTHMDGLALDFFIEGIDGKGLWERIREKNCCGVGHYGGKEIHLDASRPRFWEAATSKVNTNESDYNRRMFLSTDLDRYRPGQGLRLSFSSVSHFGFGIRKKAVLITDPEGNQSLTEIEIQAQSNGDCLTINDRQTSHWINLILPKNIKEGRYRLLLDFCQRPFAQMPVNIMSNEIEILSPN